MSMAFQLAVPPGGSPWSYRRKFLKVPPVTVLTPLPTLAFVPAPKFEIKLINMSEELVFPNPTVVPE